MDVKEVADNSGTDTEVYIDLSGKNLSEERFFPEPLSKDFYL